MGSYVWPNHYVGQTFHDEVAWLKAWVSDRMQWLDSNLPLLVTSTEHQANKAVNVFPNPFAGYFNVQISPQALENCQVQIINVAGAIVEQKNIPVGQNGVGVVSIGNSLAKGFYFYRILQAGKEIAGGKVIKH
jgi:hypothetical protein